MINLESLNPFAQQVMNSVLRAFPAWAEYCGHMGKDDIEIAVPAPSGSKAGHLIIFTNENSAWVRFAPPNSGYAFDSVSELLETVDSLMRDGLCIAVIKDQGEWACTSLTPPGEVPPKEPTEITHVYSWSGKHDAVIPSSPLGPRLRKT